MNKEAGFSLLEYIIALVLVMVAFVTWLQLTTTGVKNGRFVQKLADVKALSSNKATELGEQAETILQKFTANQTKLGSLEPNNPVINPALNCCYEQLNYRGDLITIDPNTGKQVLITQNKQVITNPAPNELIAQFTRQWIIIKDEPTVGDVTIYVSVADKDPNQIVRVAKLVKTDGFN
jgi:hypothetical protein